MPDFHFLFSIIGSHAIASKSTAFPFHAKDICHWPCQNHNKPSRRLLYTFVKKWWNEYVCRKIPFPWLWNRCPPLCFSGKILQTLWAWRPSYLLGKVTGVMLKTSSRCLGKRMNLSHLKVVENASKCCWRPLQPLFLQFYIFLFQYSLKFCCCTCAIVGSFKTDINVKSGRGSLKECSSSSLDIWW